MDAKTYLGQIRRLEVIIKQNRQQLAEIRAVAEYHSPVALGENVQTSPKGDGLASAVAAIIAAEERLAFDTAQLVVLRTEIVATIQSLPNPVHVDLLYRRYVLFQPWEQIARAMNYSKDSVRGRIQRAALAAVENILAKKQSEHTMPHFPVA